MPIEKIKDYLNTKGVKYVTISHSPAYTAQTIAASAHIPGKELAKTVVVRLDNKLAMAVLPASKTVDFKLLKSVTGSKEASLASEQEFRDKFPGCEVGAMPPFGNLYDMEVFVTESLAADDEIAFNAGSHTELIRMKYDDYDDLVKPTKVRFSHQ